MAPPSKLAIATSSLKRLIKEEASYHKELSQQESRIKKLEAGSEDENAEYQLKQEKRALEETKAVLPSMKQKIVDGLAQLEAQIEANADAAEGDITKAKEVVGEAKEALKNDS
ncbi:tubulin-specific chaperone-like protein Rbl2 [Tothia fuscella]|uniref:Tubulin-specific chaperone A n=1 Tax=Tothia fuscella TaxID=1048955 RepID=A0A9P4NIC3_9PEZI|nr:tubulin-specific chaperone-like protein Rbl2 [Tothia fuscella]